MYEVGTVVYCNSSLTSLATCKAGVNCPENCANTSLCTTYGLYFYDSEFQRVVLINANNSTIEEIIICGTETGTATEVSGGGGGGGGGGGEVSCFGADKCSFGSDIFRAFKCSDDSEIWVCRGSNLNIEVNQCGGCFETPTCVCSTGPGPGGGVTCYFGAYSCDGVGYICAKMDTYSVDNTKTPTYYLAQQSCNCSFC